MKSSARVLQLKRELEDLDARLMQTNTVNFDEMRTSMLRDAINNNDADINSGLHHRSRAAVAIEEQRYSVSQQSINEDVRSSV